MTTSVKSHPSAASRECTTDQRFAVCVTSNSSLSGSVTLAAHLCILIFHFPPVREKDAIRDKFTSEQSAVLRVYRLNVGRAPAPLLCTAATDDFSSGDLLQLEDMQVEPDITSAGELVHVWLNKGSPGTAEKNKDYQPALHHHLFITNYLINKEFADKGSVIKSFFFFFKFNLGNHVCTHTHPLATVDQ